MLSFADYASIERIIARLRHDGVEGDLYRLAGEEHFGRPITETERRDIKVAAFGFMYGAETGTLKGES